MTNGSKTVIELVEQVAADAPGRLALQYLVDGTAHGRAERITYSELVARARAIGMRLKSEVGAGNRVLLLYPTGTEFACAFLGCLYAGVVAVPTDPSRWQRSHERLGGVVLDSGAHTVLTARAYLTELESDPAASVKIGQLRWIASDDGLCDSVLGASFAAPDPDAIAFLQYTSGSTGMPKGVAITQRNVVHNVSQLLRVGGTPEDAHSVSWAPVFHDMGLIAGIMYPLCTGVSGTLLSPLSFLQRPLRWLEALSHFRGTFSTAPNFAFDLCVKRATPEALAGLDLSCVEYIGNGAEPVRLETLERFYRTFAATGFKREALLPCYGLAESTLIVTAASRGGTWKTRHHQERSQTSHSVSCGAPVNDTEVAIVNAKSGSRCPDGEVGEIWLRGPSVASGYWDSERGEACPFDARLASGEGPFLRTGDLAWMEAGELYVAGRHQDLIIVDGQNHYPHDIEFTVEQCHASVRPGGTAAFSLDVAGKECVVVIAEMQPGTTDYAEIATRIRSHVSREHELEIHALALVKPRSVPKTTSGKVRRKACREAFVERSLPLLFLDSRSGVDSRSAVSVKAVKPVRQSAEIEAWLTEQLSILLGVNADSIDRNTAFSNLGLGSRKTVELSALAADWLGNDVSPLICYRYPTIRKLSSALGPPVREIPSSAPAAREETDADSPLAIAIVGIGCRVPGASGAEEFWSLLRDGVDGTAEVPPERWDVDEFYAAEAGTPGKTNARRGGFLPRVADFDPSFFGVSEAEATHMDPQHRLLLQVAWEALEDGGVVEEQLAGSSTGVFVGLTNSDYGRMQLSQSAGVGPYAATGSVHCIAANRISYTFDLRGPSLTVDTACSSSLVAIHYACESIRRGESSAALAGGVNLILSPVTGIALSQIGALSPDGRCHAFDARANGYARGEGAALVLLKPLAQAVADGDRIYAVIRSSGVNQDGRSNGLRAPSAEAQTELMVKACAAAGVSSAQVQYVEAHGTGTALGDPIEASAISAALTLGRAADEPCAIGSVKTNFGHLESAAGVAGLIKVALSLHHRQLPASLHFETPNPRIPFADWRLRVPTELEPWPSQEPYRIAGVNSFGVGGTNAHVIVSESPASAVSGTRGASTWGSNERPCLLVLSAKLPQGLPLLAERFAAQLSAAPFSLPAMAYTAALRRTHHAHRLAIVARSAQELSQRLADYARGTSSVGVTIGRVGKRARRLVFVYPGQGGQYLGMGRKLFQSESAFRARFEQCDQLMRPYLNWSLCEELFAEADQSRLEQDAVAQPLLFAIQVSLTAQWQALGIVPDAVVGHSMGEVAAAEAAGALTLEQAVAVTCLRSDLIRRHPAPEGGMALIGLSMEETLAVLAPFGGALHLAASNGPMWSVVSGELDALTQLLTGLEHKEIFCRRVKAKGAGHSPAVDPIARGLGAGLAKLSPKPTSIPFYSALSAELRAGETLGAEYWARSMREPVLFCPALRKMVQDGFDLFLELSPNATLVPAINQILSEASVEGSACCSLSKERDEPEALFAAFGALHASGCTVDFSRLCSGSVLPVSLPAYPWQTKRYWAAFTPFHATAETASEQPTGLDDDAASQHYSVEELVAQAWTSVLKVPTIGAQDSFFELGGTSLSASQMLFELRSSLKRNIPTRTIFDNPKFGDFIAKLATVGSDAPIAISRREGARFPLSLQQERNFGGSMTTSPAFASSLALIGSVNVDALERALRYLIERHDAFQVTFQAENERHVQVLEPVALSFPYHDLSDLNAADMDVQIKQLLEEIERDFDLRTDIPFRFQLIRRAPQHHIFTIAVHHVIFDFWSMQVFLEELTEAYECFGTGLVPQLGPPSIRYVDYATWQRTQLSGAVLEKFLNFWRINGEILQPTLPGFAQKPRSQGAPPREANIMNVPLDAGATAKLHTLAQACGCTMGMITLSAVLALLHRYTPGKYSCIPVLDANRTMFETQRTLGKFADYRIIRVRMRPHATTKEHIASVKEAVLKANEEQVVSLPNYECLEKLPPRAFPIFFNYVPTFQGVGKLGEAVATPFAGTKSKAFFWEMQIGAMELPTGMLFRVFYANDLDEVAVRRFGDSLLEIIREMVARPDRALTQPFAEPNLSA